MSAEGERVEPHTLENFVTHRSGKCCLSRNCPYVRMNVRPYNNTLKTKKVAPLQYM